METELKESDKVILMASAARGCSERVGGFGAASYAYRVEYLGMVYSVSGVFTRVTEGLVQLEVVSPAEASAFVSDLTRSFFERNAGVARNPPR